MGASYIEDYGLSTPVRTSLIALLYLKDNSNSSMDILHIQKVLRYYDYLKQTKQIDFSNFKLGAVSYDIEENLEDLLELDLVSERNHKFELTTAGNCAAEEIIKTIPAKDVKILEFAKKQLNELTTEEVLAFMYFLLPQTQIHSTVIKDIQKKKVELILSLYSKGKISLSQASAWLDISEREFTSKYGVKLGRS